MSKFVYLFIIGIGFLAIRAQAASYSTEATITPLPEKGQYQVDVMVARVVELNGKSVEQIVARPRILSGVGCPASFYQGLAATNPDYAKQENIGVDVSWPYPNESGVAACTVIVKHGDEVVSKSSMRLQIAGPGREPLRLSPAEVDPKSVQATVKNKRNYVLLQFSGRTEDAARKLAIANLGNHVQVQTADGTLIMSGFMSGTYRETGLAVEYPTADEARRVASILQDATVK